MRIVAINASYRGDKGLTRFFVDRLLQGAAAEGAKCRVITLARHKINRCLSCNRCQKGEPRLVCVQSGQDDVEGIFAEMARADLLVYATPVYALGMAGLLKLLLERLYSTMDIGDVRLSNGLIHHHVNPALSSKPFVVLALCNNVEDEMLKNVASYFRTYARFMEAHQAGVLLRNAAQLFDPQGDPALAQQFPRMQAVCRAYEQAGRELGRLGHIRRSTQRAANQEIVPVPFFGALKHLYPVKGRVVAYLRRQAQ